ncbi:hypothetical protein B0H12DRAFT_1328105 [Mycena haematopus]|nr:hypothetical protein B0H12DRAFT_1328105 [Mycena haematopus]
MPFNFKRMKNSSDYDEDFIPPPPKRVKPAKRPVSLPPSSPPPPWTPEQEYSPELHVFDNEDEGNTLGPLPPLLLPILSASGSSDALQTSRHIPAASLEPSLSSPMSILDTSPVKRGRPQVTPKTARLKLTARSIRTSQRTPDKQKLREIEEKLETKSANLAANKARVERERLEVKNHEKKLLAESKANEAAERQAISDAQNTVRAQQVLELITASEGEGGFNFESLEEFFELFHCPIDRLSSMTIVKITTEIEIFN